MNFEIADSSTEKTVLSWFEAREYVKTLGNEWRLPTRDELDTIYYCNNDFQQEKYWSDTGFSNSAWLQDFRDGTQDYYNKNLCINVRAVRTIK